MQSVAIIGFGCAGYNAVKAIRENGGHFEIDVYSNTDEGPYNPMLTTYYVSGKISEMEMFPFGSLKQIQEKLNIHVFRNTTVTELRANEKCIVTADGTEKIYDYIVIATGARAVLPPIKNIPERNAYTMRTVEDARCLRKALESDVTSAVVVGGQMVGIKVVELLHKRNIQTTLVDMAKQIFPLSATAHTAKIIEQRLKDSGIELEFGSALTAVEETTSGLISYFSNGTKKQSDIIVFCSGIRSNISFVNFNEIEIGHAAIKTDLHMQTNIPGIYAVGDCCETKDLLNNENSYIGLWANANMQGRIAGENICGMNTSYSGNLIHNITHYMDTDFISIGDCRADGEHLFWKSKDNSWELEAILNERKLLAVNILDNANVTGVIKQILLHRAVHPEQKMTEVEKLVLQRSGMNANIITKLGGGSVD